MNDRDLVRRRRMAACDRQVLAAAYSPVIALVAVLIAARISRTRRRQLQAVRR